MIHRLLFALTDCKQFAEVLDDNTSQLDARVDLAIKKAEKWIFDIVG